MLFTRFAIALWLSMLSLLDPLLAKAQERMLEAVVLDIIDEKTVLVAPFSYPKRTAILHHGGAEEDYDLRVPKYSEEFILRVASSKRYLRGEVITGQNGFIDRSGGGRTTIGGKVLDVSAQQGKPILKSDGQPDQLKYVQHLTWKTWKTGQVGPTQILALIHDVNRESGVLLLVPLNYDNTTPISDFVLLRLRQKSAKQVLHDIKFNSRIDVNKLLSPKRSFLVRSKRFIEMPSGSFVLLDGTVKVDSSSDKEGRAILELLTGDEATNAQLRFKATLGTVTLVLQDGKTLKARPLSVEKRGGDFNLKLLRTDGTEQSIPFKNLDKKSQRLVRAQLKVELRLARETKNRNKENSDSTWRAGIISQ